MRKFISLLILTSLSGCASVKWVYTNPVSGETWWISQGPLRSDEINYCAPVTTTPSDCHQAVMLESPPLSR